MTIRTKKSPPDLLRAKQPVVVKLSRELGLSRWHTYGLLLPNDYRDAIPADLFDTRSDLADRIAAFIQIPVETVRGFYEKVAA